MCISQSPETRKWTPKECKTQLVEDEETEVTRVQCLCKTVNPVTLVEDTDDFFGDNKLDEVFSGEGLAALREFQFHRMYVFYVLLIKTVSFLWLMKVADRMDKQKITNQVKVKDIVIINTNSKYIFIKYKSKLYL